MNRSHRGAILIVEDDRQTLAGYVEYLTAAGYKVTGVGDGSSALTLAIGDPPAAVVTDITLPGMSGFELAAGLRADARTREIPVIGLTGHWGPEVHTRANEVNMRVVLLKPCTPSHLVAELRRALILGNAAPAGE